MHPTKPSAAITNHYKAVCIQLVITDWLSIQSQTPSCFFSFTIHSPTFTPGVPNGAGGTDLTKDLQFHYNVQISLKWS